MAKASPFKQSDVSVADAVSYAYSEASSLRDELQDWYDNLPESFQNGSKGDALQEALSGLDACDSEPSVDELGDVTAERVVVYVSKKRRLSRADRCSDACSHLRAVIEHLEERVSEYESERSDDDESDYPAWVEAAQTLITDLTDAADAWENIEFPGMYG